MIKKTNIDFSISPKRKNPLTVGVQLSSYDKNFHEFEISFLEKELEESDTVNILTVFESSKRDSKSTTEIRGGSALFSFDTTLIDRDEVVTNYVYLKSGDSQAEIGAFRFDVKLSEIDNEARVIAKAYDESYESLIQDFEKEIRDYLPKLETINQEESIRQDEEAVRKLAEADRVTSEDTRVSAESERVSNEEIRQTNEQQRELAEFARQNEFETNEVERENTFEENEGGRQSEFEERYEQLEEEYAPKLTEVTAQLAQKASKTEVNNLIGNISVGTPLFANSIANMTDNSRLYVNTSDGYIYAHNGTTFINTNVLYQARGLDDYSVTDSKLAKTITDRIGHQILVDVKDFSDFTSTTDRSQTPTTRVLSKPSTSEGKLVLHLKGQTERTTTVHVLERDGNSFKSLRSETIKVSVGTNRIETNLDISYGNWVGIRTNYITYYKYAPSGTTYVLEGDVGSGFVEFEPTTFDLAVFYEVFKKGTLQTLAESKEFETRKYFGKLFYMFGDSITYWDTSTINPEDVDRPFNVKGLGSYIREELGGIVQNYAVGGYTAKQVTDKVVQTDLSNVDVMTYSAGTNDPKNGVLLGTIDDSSSDNTFYGNVKRAVEYAYAQNPDIKIFMYTPHLNYGADNNEPFADALVAMGRVYGYPVYDAYHDMQINDLNKSNYLVDNIHLNAKGYRLYADGLIPFINNN